MVLIIKGVVEQSENGAWDLLAREAPAEDTEGGREMRGQAWLFLYSKPQ
jgi:hypothetical protein